MACSGFPLSFAPSKENSQFYLEECCEVLQTLHMHKVHSSHLALASNWRHLELEDLNL